MICELCNRELPWNLNSFDGQSLTLFRYANPIPIDRLISMLKFNQKIL